MKFIGIIPARYASTRFPGKPLAMLDGKPVIQHVYEKVGHHLSALEQVHGQVLLRVCHCRRLQPHGCERQGIRG